MPIIKGSQKYIIIRSLDLRARYTQNC